jgi:hypothetical protein
VPYTEFQLDLMEKQSMDIFNYFLLIYKNNNLLTDIVAPLVKFSSTTMNKNQFYFALPKENKEKPLQE